MPEGAEGDGAASVEDRAAWAAAANDDHQTRAKTTEEIVEEEAKLEQAAKDTAAWMNAPGIAAEERAKTTDELVAEVQQQQQQQPPSDAGTLPAPPVPAGPQPSAFKTIGKSLGQASSGLVQFLDIDPSSWKAMLEMCALMFMWGLANNLNDILIKQFKKAFELGNLQAGLVQTALYIGYFVGAPPAAIVANRTSYKVSILIGLSLYAGGAILFWPAGLVRAYPLFLTALLIIGLGLACLETSVSPYLIRFGPSETAARRINFAAVFNPLGSIVGILCGKLFVFNGKEWSHCDCHDLPLNDSETCGILMTKRPDIDKKVCQADAVESSGCFITPGIGDQHTMAELACSAAEVDAFRAEAAEATKIPYLTVACAVLVVAIAVTFTRLPAYGGQAAAGSSASADAPSRQPKMLEQLKRWLFTALDLLKRNSRFRYGVLAQFAYVGAQIGVWSYLILYMQNNVPNTSEKVAADMVSYSLMLLTVGRAVSTALLRVIRGVQLMGIFGMINVVLMTVGIFVGGSSGTYAIVASSFFMSLMFPTIFTIAIRGLDKDQTQLGSSLIVMSIIGGAVLTPAMGLTSDIISVNAAYFVPLCAFVAVTIYAFVQRNEDDAMLVPEDGGAASAGVAADGDVELANTGDKKDFAVGAATSAAAAMAATSRSKAVIKSGMLKKLGGKDKDKWQERKVSVSASDLRWAKGLSDGTLNALEIESVTIWSALDMPDGFGFEVCSRVKDGKVYKFVAPSEIERDNWMKAIANIIGDTDVAAVVNDSASAGVSHNPLAQEQESAETGNVDSPEPTEDQIRAAKDLNAWVNAPSVANEGRALTTEELVQQAESTAKTTDELVLEAQQDAKQFHEAGVAAVEAVSVQQKTAVGVGEGATI